MKFEVHGWHTNIFPTDDEVKELCKPGTEDCCVWITAGGKGFECMYNHKPHSLVKRFEAGETRARRDGCDFVKDLSMVELGIGSHEVVLNEQALAVLECQDCKQQENNDQ